MDEPELSAENAGKSKPVKKRRRRERRYRLGPHKRRRWPQLRWWREALLVVFLLTAVFFLINPFPRWANAWAVVAEPVQPIGFALSSEPEEGYCLAGDFQDWNGQSTRLLDDGTEGDRTAGDGIYSRAVTIAEPERYLWRVLACGNWDTAVPEQSAWVFVTQPNQSVLFTFTPAMPATSWWPRSYAMTANDTLPGRVVAVGTFQVQQWNSGDSRTQMQPSGNDQFNLAYTVQQPGEYAAYVSIQGRSEGVGATGRSTQPVPLIFTTEFPAETVVFQYDGRTNRIAVLSGIPWWLSWLGYGWGARIIAGISVLGMLVMAGQIGYRRFVLRPDWQVGAGCPSCQEPDLRRINRQNLDYLLNLIGVPVRRFKCTHCGWEGRRMQRRRH